VVPISIMIIIIIYTMKNAVNQSVPGVSRRVFRYALKLKDYEPSRRALPIDFDCVGFRKGFDEEALLELNNDIFLGHPDQGALTLGLLYQRLCASDPAAHQISFVRFQKEPVGFLWLKWHRLLNINPCEIYVLGLIERARGVGVAQYLIDLAASAAHESGCELLWVYTDESNLIARKVYEERGFALDLISTL
jgi:mycothiol synthase